MISIRLNRMTPGAAMVKSVTQRATMLELLATDGKAELIGGRIVSTMPTGLRPNRVAGRIFLKLAEYEQLTRRGIALTDNIGFAVPELPSGRESFSPDAAFYTGPLPHDDMRFIEGAPDFAVEVRSENDYTPAAEIDLAAKRADYFAAGTKVVWDVDPMAGTIASYSAVSAEQPTLFGHGEVAHAEPALIGWRVEVDWVMGA